MSSIDQQFVEFVVKSLVGKPDAVSINRTIDEKGVLLELTVDPEDLGRVIGKRGATAQSLRTLLRALGTKNEARYNLKIIDNGVYDSNRTSEPLVEQTTASPKSDDQNDQPVTTADDDNEDPEEYKADHSDVISKTRRELEELDDLDV